MLRPILLAPILLSLAVAPVRLYHPVTIQDLAAGKVRHTHVETSGFPVYQRMEADGDRHTALCDSPTVKEMDRTRCAVLECLPELPCPRPPIGKRVTVGGIVRFDAENGHGWWELHPLLRWSW